MEIVFDIESKREARNFWEQSRATSNIILKYS